MRDRSVAPFVGSQLQSSYWRLRSCNSRVFRTIIAEPERRTSLEAHPMLTIASWKYSYFREYLDTINYPRTSSSNIYCR